MKNKIFCLLAITTISFISCKKQEKSIVPTVISNKSSVNKVPADAKPVSNNKPTEMVFTETEHNFGTINQGDKVMHVFTFKNTGSNDLIISRANGSCGCTVPEFTKDPIPPGKTGTMKVSFSSTGKSGPQQKTVTVSANVPNGAQVLTIKANVKVDKTKK